MLVHLYLYTHIWGRHGHLVLTSCVVAWYMYFKLIMGCHGMYKTQLNIPHLTQGYVENFVLSLTS